MQRFFFQFLICTLKIVLGVQFSNFAEEGANKEVCTKRVAGEMLLLMIPTE